MSSIKSLQPGVIDEAMIQKSIEDLAPKGEAGRLMKEEGIPTEEITCLRLEYLNILKIDHLWMLTGLTKLHISNNIIEKIENIEALVNLIELDLSFNYIEKIENLDELINLEILTLYRNKIKKIENIDTLTKLIIFSIGCNELEDKTNILYLRQFNNLRSLNLAGNPLCNEENIRPYIAAFLPNLTYYEYKMIFYDERQAACELYSRELIKLIESEAELRERLEKLAADAVEEELHSESFVEHLGGRALFDEMFENDAEGKTFLLIGNDAEEIYKEYENQFLEKTKNLFIVGQEQYQLRKFEVEQFFSCVTGAKDASQKTSQEIMETFMLKQNEIFLSVRNLQQTQMLEVNEAVEDGDDTNELCTYHGCVEKFNNLIHDTWKQLMRIELILFEQLEETNAAFEHNLTDMINSFIEKSQGFFAECRTLEVSYCEQIGELCNGFITSINTSTDLAVLHEDLQKIMTDKEILMNAIAASHDTHMQVIDAREDRLMSRAHNWLKNLVDNLSRNEINRNRNKILEINHFLDIQREEFEDIQIISTSETELDLEDRQPI